MIITCKCGYRIDFNECNDSSLDVTIKCPACKHHMKLQSDDLF